MTLLLSTALPPALDFPTQETETQLPLLPSPPPSPAMSFAALRRPVAQANRSAVIATRAFSSTPAPQATLRELEMRIRSVGNIGKITKSE